MQAFSLIDEFKEALVRFRLSPSEFISNLVACSDELTNTYKLSQLSLPDQTSSLILVSEDFSAISEQRIKRAPEVIREGVTVNQVDPELQVQILAVCEVEGQVDECTLISKASVTGIEILLQLLTNPVAQDLLCSPRYNFAGFASRELPNDGKLLVNFVLVPHKTQASGEIVRSELDIELVPLDFTTALNSVRENPKKFGNQVFSWLHHVTETSINIPGYKPIEDIVPINAIFDFCRFISTTPPQSHFKWSSKLRKKSLKKAKKIIDNPEEEPEIELETECWTKLPSGYGAFEALITMLLRGEDRVREMLLGEEYEVLGVAYLSHPSTSILFLKFLDDDFDFEDLEEMNQSYLGNIQNLRQNPTQMVPFVQEMTESIVDDRVIYFEDVLPVVHPKARQLFEDLITFLNEFKPVAKLTSNRLLIQLCKDCGVFKDHDIYQFNLRDASFGDNDHAASFKMHVLDRIQNDDIDMIKLTKLFDDTSSSTTVFMELLLNLDEKLKGCRCMLTDSKFSHVGVWTDQIDDENREVTIFLASGEPQERNWENQETKTTVSYEFDDDVVANEKKEAVDEVENRVLVKKSTLKTLAKKVNTLAGMKNPNSNLNMQDIFKYERKPTRKESSDPDKVRKDSLDKTIAVQSNSPVDTRMINEGKGESGKISDSLNNEKILDDDRKKYHPSEDVVLEISTDLSIIISGTLGTESFPENDQVPLKDIQIEILPPNPSSSTLPAEPVKRELFPSGEKTMNKTEAEFPKTQMSETTKVEHMTAPIKTFDSTARSPISPLPSEQDSNFKNKLTSVEEKPKGGVVFANNSNELKESLLGFSGLKSGQVEQMSIEIPSTKTQVQTNTRVSKQTCCVISILILLLIALIIIFSRK